MKIGSSSQFQLIVRVMGAVFHVLVHSVAFTNKNEIAINGAMGGGSSLYMLIFRVKI